jgi:hypothetical protein
MKRLLVLSLAVQAVQGFIQPCLKGSCSFTAKSRFHGKFLSFSVFHALCCSCGCLQLTTEPMHVSHGIALTYMMFIALSDGALVFFWQQSDYKAVAAV